MKKLGPAGLERIRESPSGKVMGEVNLKGGNLVGKRKDRGGYQEDKLTWEYSWEVKDQGFISAFSFLQHSNILFLNGKMKLLFGIV